MSTFVKGGSTGTPFGRNEFLRSVRDVKFESYTFAAATLPSVTIDGVAGQKVLQPGVLLSKITSGADAGKIGPSLLGVASVTDGRDLAANVVGLNSTFLPWQLMERDVEVAVVYEATVVQAWCLEYNAVTLVGLAPVALTNASRDLIRNGVNNAATLGLSLNFR